MRRPYWGTLKILPELLRQHPQVAWQQMSQTHPEDVVPGTATIDRVFVQIGEARRLRRRKSPNETIPVLVYGHAEQTDNWSSWRIE